MNPQEINMEQKRINIVSSIYRKIVTEETDLTVTEFDGLSKDENFSLPVIIKDKRVFHDII